MSDMVPFEQPPPAQLALSQKNVKAILSKPFRLLPDSVQPAAFRAWCCYRHLPGMESGLPICTLIAVWIDQHGIHPEDAVACLDRLLAPEMVGGMRFASDLTSALGGAVQAAKRERREREELARRRAEEEENRRNAVTPQPGLIRQIIKRMGEA